MIIFCGGAEVFTKNWFYYLANHFVHAYVDAFFNIMESFFIDR